MTPANDTSAPTRYLVEHLRTVVIAGNPSPLTAWVAVGDIELDDKHYHRAAFEAWVGEQTEEPPLGAYRVVRHESYGSSLVEFEIVETREREIRRVERPDPVTEQPEVTPAVSTQS